MWVALHAESVFWTDWPPAPLERVYWYFMSVLFTWNVNGIDGITTIDIVDECNLPLLYVSGTLITLWTPA